MSKSQTIINDDWLPNEHTGVIVHEEFMQPLQLEVDELANKTGVKSAALHAVIAGKQAIDAEMDLRLGRYFGMTEGYFLRLQQQYDLLEAKRALNGALDKITPRAA